MISLHQAYERLFSQSIPLQTQILELFQSSGRILAQDVFASRDLPAFSNSAMDGYAISHLASSYTLQESLFAGDIKSVEILPNHCVKIMTGARIPQNTFAIIPFEHTQIQDQQIIPTHPIQANQHIKFCGEDYQKGEKLLSRGTRLDYASLALLASQGIHQILTFTLPKIAIFASGDEIKEPWEEAQEFQVYNSNGIAYSSILQNFGFPSTYAGILPDCKEQLLEAIQTFGHNDLVLTSGGASVGEADFFEEALRLSGAEIIFHGINLKPGRPMLVAKLHHTLIFSLPGNPLSGCLNLITLVIPTIQKLIQHSHHHPFYIQTTLSEDLSLKSKRSNMILGHFNGEFFTPYQKGKYGSGSLKPLQNSNAIAVFSEEQEKLKQGERIAIILIDCLNFL